MTTAKTAGADYWGANNSVAFVYMIEGTATRSSKTSKQVKIEVRVDAGMRYVKGVNGATGSSGMASGTSALKVRAYNHNYFNYEQTGTFKAVDQYWWSCKENNVNGTTPWTSKKYSGGGNTYTGYNNRYVTFNITGNWTSGTRLITLEFLRGTTVVATDSIILTMPAYSESGGGTDPEDPVVNVGANRITSISPSTTRPEVGEDFTITATGSIGNNNGIQGWRISGPNAGVGTVLDSSTSHTFDITAPSTSGSYTYTVTMVSSKGSSYNVTSSVNINVQEKTVDPVNIRWIIPSAVDGNSGGYVTLRVDGTSWAYAIGSSGASKNIVTGQSSTSINVRANQTIYVWGYEDGQYSNTYDSITVGITYDVSVSNFLVTPEILKDNLSEPDLVTLIQNGSVSAQSSGGGITYEWQYAQAPNISSLASASYSSLGVSGSSFSNIDMTQKVNKGYYYKIRAVASNSYGSSDYSQDSEIYQIPKDPGSPTSIQVIPNADPSKGYTEIIKDNKKYYGSGVFMIWNNPVIDESQMPIAEIELIYQSKSPSGFVFGETKIAQFFYREVLQEDGTVKDYFDTNTEKPFITSGTNTGGGADLEVTSLYETKVGIRITDTLGQYSDTYYTVENFFKAESPSFGGNLTVELNDTGNPEDTVATFRPFTCDPDGIIIFTSSVARSNSQDVLYYDIDCYINDRKVRVPVIEDAPISTAAFADVSINPGDILYSDANITIKKFNGTIVSYEVKNSYFKEKLLEERNLRTPKGNLNSVYNDNFFEVTYKISVTDDFDARSTIYSSANTNIKYIEAPSLLNNPYLEIGINRYMKSQNPFYDSSINMVNTGSNNNDRMVNPGESIIFKFKRAQDYNAADHETTMLGDVTQYNVYVSRNDEIVVSNYENLNYTLLKTFSVETDLKKAYPNNSSDEYYYLEYPLQSYLDSKFVVFRIEAVDSKSLTSNYLYSNTYIVPCRATSMDFFISNVRLSETVTGYDLTFRVRVSDFGASTFVNEQYGYDKAIDEYSYPNYERSYSVNNNTFSRKGYIIFEGSLDGNFTNTTITLNENDYNNYYSETIDLLQHISGDQKYPDILELPYSSSLFPTEWQTGIKNGDIKRIFFRLTYKIAYGFLDIEKTDFDERYLIVTSVSTPYSYYEDSPTFSYRNHQVGINTKDFSADNEDEQKEVLIIQDNGSYNLVVFKGAEQRIYLNLTQRTFYIEDNEEPPNRIAQISFNTNDNNVPFIDGMILDGGDW